MVTFAVNIFERMRIKLTFLCSKPCWINISVFFVISYFLPMILSLIRSIIFDTSGHMRLTFKDWMFLSPIVFTLWNTSICTSTIYSSNKLFYVETIIDDWLSFESRLWIPDIDSDDSWIRVRRSLNDFWLWC